MTDKSSSLRATAVVALIGRPDPITVAKTGAAVSKFTAATAGMTDTERLKAAKDLDTQVETILNQENIRREASRELRRIVGDLIFRG